MTPTVDVLSTLMTATSIVGLPVISMDTCAAPAYVRELLYDAHRGVITGFTLSQPNARRTPHASLLLAHDVFAIGRDAVMIANDDALTDKSAYAAPLAKVTQTHNVLGVQVMTTDGVKLGHVVDVIVAVGGTGKAVGYRIVTLDGRVSYLPIPTQIAISGSTLVVPTGTLAFVRDDLTGLGAAVEGYRTRIGLHT